jgi:hypothetical protein
MDFSPSTDTYSKDFFTKRDQNLRPSVSVHVTVTRVLQIFHRFQRQGFEVFARHPPALFGAEPIGHYEHYALASKPLPPCSIE